VAGVKRSEPSERVTDPIVVQPSRLPGMLTLRENMPSKNSIVIDH
jgi:hypothetical protein